MLPLSVLLAVRDEEAEPPGALASVAGWSDEIVVVVDTRTRDRTGEVAAGAGARVTERVFDGLGAQRRHGLAMCRNRWILVLDADERVSSTLKAGIGEALEDGGPGAFAMRRANVVLGRRLRHGDWGHDWVTRLFDVRRARIDDHPVHPSVAAERVGRVRGTLEHHTLRSLEQYVPKLFDYAARGAPEAERGGLAGGVPIAAVRAGWRFFRGYVLRAGVLDGQRGLLVAGLSAWGTFLKWSLVWQSRTDG